MYSIKWETDILFGGGGESGSLAGDRTSISFFKYTRLDNAFILYCWMFKIIVPLHKYPLSH